MNGCFTLMRHIACIVKVPVPIQLFSSADCFTPNEVKHLVGE